MQGWKSAYNAMLPIGENNSDATGIQADGCAGGSGALEPPNAAEQGWGMYRRGKGTNGRKEMLNSGQGNYWSESSLCSCQRSGQHASAQRPGMGTTVHWPSQLPAVERVSHAYQSQGWSCQVRRTCKRQRWHAELEPAKLHGCAPQLVAPGQSIGRQERAECPQTGLSFTATTVMSSTTPSSSCSHLAHAQSTSCRKVAGVEADAGVW